MYGNAYTYLGDWMEGNRTGYAVLDFPDKISKYMGTLNLGVCVFWEPCLSGC